MRYLWILFLCIGCNINSHSDVRMPSSSCQAKESVSIQKDSLYTIWNDIVDSMVLSGRNKFIDNRYFQNLVEEMGRLNKEEKIFKLVLPSLSANRTLYFMHHLNGATGVAISSYWGKINKSRVRSSDIYTYRFYRYKKNLSYFKDEYDDSVKIYHTEELNNYSEELLSLCNKWDTTAIMTREDLLEPMRDDTYVFAVRVIIKDNSKYTLQYIPVMRNLDSETIVGYPSHMVIPEPSK